MKLLCMKHHFALLVFSLLCVVPACDTGLTPLNEPSGFRGVIRFQNWPPADSVRELRIVAFESLPTDSSTIIESLLAGTAAVYPPLDQQFPKFVDSVEYEFTTKKGINLKLRNYTYIILAQQFGPNILSDWQTAGVYSTRPNSFEPAPLRVLLHRTTPNVDINVDFHNPPPTPWRR